jgi:hypothetical protein
MASDERVASLSVEIKRLEGAQQTQLAELNNAHERAKVAEESAAEFKKAKLEAESALAVEREKTKGAVIVEGKKGVVAIVVALIMLVSGAVGAWIGRASKADAATAAKPSPSQIARTPSADEPLAGEPEKIVDVWRSHVFDSASVNDIARNASNHAYAGKELADLVMTTWKSGDATVCADFGDQSGARVTIDRFVVLAASRDASGNLYAFGDYVVLGPKLTYVVYRMNNGQSPPKLVITSPTRGSVVLELGSCSVK